MEVKKCMEKGEKEKNKVENEGKIRRKKEKNSVGGLVGVRKGESN